VGYEQNGGGSEAADSLSLVRHPISEDDAAIWVVKASARSAPLVALAGEVGDPAPVASRVVNDVDDWQFGRFMLAWLDRQAAVRLVHHLPDASFFLRLLEQAYQPVFDRQPQFIELLRDQSRPEMSLTNDVLQIQLHDLGPRYSMVRHHALMLFHAALWLEQPRRHQWLALYDALLTHVDERPQGRPGLAELADVEAGAFKDFALLAARTVDESDAVILLANAKHELDRVLDYQLYAAAAIGLLWRQYRSLSDTEREEWLLYQFAEAYMRLDYLEEEWTAR